MNTTNTLLLLLTLISSSNAFAIGFGQWECMTKDNKVIFVVKQLEPEPIKIVRKDGAVTYKAVVIDSFSIETEGVVMRKGMELIWAWFIGKRYFQLNIDMNGTGRFYDWSYVPEASLPAYKSKYKCNQSKD